MLDSRKMKEVGRGHAQSNGIGLHTIILFPPLSSFLVAVSSTPSLFKKLYAEGNSVMVYCYVAWSSAFKLHCILSYVSSQPLLGLT